MTKRKSRYIRPIHFVGDLVLINLSFFACYYWHFGAFNTYLQSPYIELQLFLNISWIVSARIVRVYRLYRVMQNDVIIQDIVKLLLLHSLLVAAYMGITHSYFYSRKFLLLFYCATTAVLPLWRLFSVYLLKLYRISGGNYRRVIIAGVSDTSKELESLFNNHPEYGYRFLGFFDDNPADEIVVEGGMNDIEQFVIENEVDEIYCAISHLTNDQLQKLICFADNNFIRIKLLPELTGFYYKNLKVDLYDHLPVLILRSIPLDNVVKKNLKRSADIIISLIVITLVLSWLLPLLGIIIKLNSKGPVFFKQRRSGLNNNFFWCWKLRTMYLANKEDFKQATKNDPRITSIGKYLRKFNLDELPQFFNVLSGDMSVVGPRPHPLELDRSYKNVVDKYMVRHYVKPGITGLSQVRGYRGETSDPFMMKNRIKIDIFYLENWSFLLDIKIIFMTIYNMVAGDKNAY